MNKYSKLMTKSKKNQKFSTGCPDMTFLNIRTLGFKLIGKNTIFERIHCLNDLISIAYTKYL